MRLRRELPRALEKDQTGAITCECHQANLGGLQTEEGDASHRVHCPLNCHLLSLKMQKLRFLQAAGSISLHFNKVILYVHYDPRSNDRESWQDKGLDEE